MSPVPRKSTFYKEKNGRFGKSLATIDTKLLKRGFKSFKTFFAFNGNGLVFRKSLSTKSHRQQKIPFSEPLGIIIDSSDSAYSTDDGQSQKSRIQDSLWKKNVANSLLYYVSRPKEEMMYCKLFSENARYNNEGLSQALKQPRSYRKRKQLHYVQEQDIPSLINLNQNHVDGNNLAISLEDMSEDGINELVKFWKGFKYKRPKRTKNVIVFNKFVIEGRAATLIDDVIVGTRMPLSKRITIRISDIKNYLEQTQPTSAQNHREKTRPQQKKKFVPVRPRPLPEAPVQQQPQPQQPATQPSTPQHQPRKRTAEKPSERSEKMQRIMPMYFRAYENHTPFGPPVEKSILRKYMIESTPLLVHPIDMYNTARAVLRFAFFGTYFRTFQINSVIMKTYACFMNWEFILNAYNMFNSTNLKLMNKLRLNKQFVAKFFRKGLIARSLRDEKLHLHRMYFEKELLRYFSPNGIPFNCRGDLLKKRINAPSKRAELDVSAAKKEIVSTLKVKDPYYWCSVVGRNSENGSLSLTSTDFTDYFENDLNSLFNLYVEKKCTFGELQEDAYLEKLNRDQVSSSKRFERLDNLKNSSKTRTEFCRKYVDKMPVVATVSEDVHSPGVELESNEIPREAMNLDKPSDESLMDADTQMGDSQMPHTPVSKISQDDDDDIPFNPNVLHIGPSHNRYDDGNPNIADVLSNRYLVMRLGTDCGKPIDPLYDNLDEKKRYRTWSDSEDENEPLDLESRKRIFNAAEKETNVPEKMAKVDNHDRINYYNDRELESELLSEYSKPEYVASGRADFPPMIAAPMKISFACLKNASFISEQFFKTSKIILGNLKTPNVVGILKNHIKNYNFIDSYELRRSFSDMPNITKHLLKDAEFSNDITDLEDLFLYFAKLQRFKVFKRVYYQDFASQYRPLYNEIKLRRYYEMAINNKMPAFTFFKLKGSCTSMPQYGQQLPKNSKAKILTHNIVIHPKDGVMLSTISASSLNLGMNQSSANQNPPAQPAQPAMNQVPGSNNQNRWPSRPSIRPAMTTLVPQRRPLPEGRVTEIRRPEGKSIVTVQEGGSSNTRIVTEVRTMPQSTEGRAMPQMTIVRTIVPITDGRHVPSTSEVKTTVEGRTNEMKPAEPRTQVEMRKFVPIVEVKTMTDERPTEVKHFTSDTRIVPLTPIKQEVKMEPRSISESRLTTDERPMPTETRLVPEGRTFVTIPQMRTMEGRNVSESGGSDVRMMSEGTRIIRTVFPVTEGRPMPDGRPIILATRAVNDPRPIAPSPSVQQYQRYDDSQHHPIPGVRYPPPPQMPSHPPPQPPAPRYSDASIMKLIQRRKPLTVKKRFQLCTPHSAACSELIEDVSTHICKIFENLLEPNECVDGEKVIDKAFNQLKKQLPRYKYLPPKLYGKHSWNSTAIPRVNTRFKSCITKFTQAVRKNVKERFKDRQHITIIVRSLNKAELLAILKTYDAKYQLQLYTMLQHPTRKMPYYDIRTLQVSLRSFTIRENLRTLVDKPLTKKTKRSQSLEPPTNKITIRRRTQSYSDLRTIVNEKKSSENTRKRRNSSVIDVMPKRQKLMNTEKLNLPALSSSPRLPIRIIPQKVWQPVKKKRIRQPKARFLSLLDFSGQQSTPELYFGDKSFTKFHFTRIGARWRLPKQLDDWWKSFRSPDEGSSAFLF